MTNPNKYSTPVTLSQSVSQRLLDKDFYLTKIHSVFPNGFNLRWEDLLVFVGKTSSDLSAVGLQVEDAVLDLFVSSLEEGMNVKLSRQGMTLYAGARLFIVDFTQVTVRDLGLKVWTQPLDSKLQKLARALEVVDPYQKSGFKKSEPMAAILKAWQDNQTSDYDFNRQLIGAGMGLTPSGDDFLQGMILMELVTQAPQLWLDQTRDLLTQRSTTDVSRAYYRALMEENQLNGAWINLLAAVQAEEWDQLPALLRRIQRYGATSGSDLLVGIQNYIQWNHRRLKNE